MNDAASTREDAALVRRSIEAALGITLLAGLAW
jgi:hypothetical protein